MRRILRISTKLNPRRQQDSNLDVHATGASPRSRILRLRKALGIRKQKRGSALVSEPEPETPLTVPSVLSTINEADSLAASANGEMTTTATSTPVSDINNDLDGPLRTVSTNIGTMNAVVTQVQTTQILNGSSNTNFRHSSFSNVNGNSTIHNHYYGWDGPGAPHSSESERPLVAPVIEEGERIPPLPKLDLSLRNVIFSATWIWIPQSNGNYSRTLVSQLP
ncbi:hypothetical protein VKT23_011474 [Stygiomarasmius scandens]|uniref:Uncharacterized protein n=1 Tax=Marasmiellus scandens TaxID=2682957 RepID=A0ABR1J8V8_9AGAR